MRRLWLCAVAWLCAACPSSGEAGGGEDGAAGPPPADASADAYAVCDTFTTVGDRCGPIGPVVCFRTCKVDGCQCKAGPNGGVWSCTSDFSCMPEAGPLDDAGQGAPDDAGPDARD